MSMRDQLRPRLRRPRQTVRLRLTLLYGGLFLVSGAGLLAITYLLVARQSGDDFLFVRGRSKGSRRRISTLSVQCSSRTGRGSRSMA